MQMKKGREEKRGEHHPTMIQNREKKHRIKSHPIIHCPTSEGVSEVSERVSEVSEGVSEASRAEQANE